MKRVPRFRLFGEEPGARFGDALAAGDFNGDNVTDLVVSAHLSTVELNNAYTLIDAGKVFVFYSPILNVRFAPSRSAPMLTRVAGAPDDARGRGQLVRKVRG